MRNRGLSLIEIILAIGVFAVLAAGLLNLVVAPLFSSGNVAGQERGMYLGQEGIEAVKAIRNTSWSNLMVCGSPVSCSYGLDQATGNWAFSGTADFTSPSGDTCTEGSADCYKRVVTVSAVHRCSTKLKCQDGDIVTSNTCGGAFSTYCVDPRTLLVESDVTWTTAFGIAQSLHYATYVTNWDNYSRKYESATDFAGGTPTNMLSTADGEEVVTLAPGEFGWTESGGVNLTATTNDDWNAGTPNNTTVYSSGLPSYLTMTPTSAWTNYFLPNTWSETTNTDFNDGTFANTAVADTGNLGSIVLNTAVDWAARTSPQATNAYNDVFLYSSSFGFAVGNGGVIAKWDGTSWTGVSSPVIDNLNSVSVLSLTDAWAVGANGKILHWDGSSWTQFVDTGAQVFRDLKMLDANNGWTVADGGIVYGWNGTVWAAESSSTTENLAGISGKPSTPIPGTVSETSDTDFNSFTSKDASVVVTGTGTAASLALTKTTATWSLPLSPTANQVNDVFALSTTSAWAVGNGGTILRWDGVTWSTVASTTVENLTGIFALSATDAWAVGANGIVLHWNGTAWSLYQDTGVENWQDIACTSATNCWAVSLNGASGSNRGRIFRYTGTTWTSVYTTGGNNQRLYSISCPSATVCRVGGDSGRIYMWNGTTWSQPIDTGSQTWTDITMLDGNNGWAVGVGGLIYRCTGTNGCDANNEWTASASGTTQNLTGVTMLSTTLAYAVGAGGAVLKWNGTSWASDTTLTTNQLNGVFALSSSYILAVGNAGTILEYAPHYPASATYVSSILDGTATVSWVTAVWTESLPAGTDITIATRTSPDGTTWTAWSAEKTNATGDPLSSPRNRYLQYRVTLYSTGGVATPTFDAITFTYDKSTPSLFAVSTGANGVIIGRSGTTWSQVASFPGTVFGDIDCLTTTDCWAVASAGRIYHWNGTAWTLHGTYGASNFNGVSMVSASLGWTVGAGGIIYKYNGTTWTAVTSPTTNALARVFAVSSTFGASVGAAGTILEFGLHYATTGTYTSHVFDSGATQAWSSIIWDKTTPGATAVSSVVAWSSTNGTTWTASVSCSSSPCSLASLAAGRYFRYVVTETTPSLDRNITPRFEAMTLTYNLPLPYDYYDLFMSSSNDGWAAGCDSGLTTGGLAHWDGTGWQNWPVPVQACYNGIGGSGPNDVWVDDNGGDTMLHWNGSTWTAYTVTSLTGSSWLTDVKCLKGDSTNCRAAGSNGLVLRWNAGTNSWSVENTGSTATIQWLSYVSANELFAATTTGAILHYLNGTWSSASFGTTYWQGVYMNSATDGWIVGGDNNGNNAAMRHWNGTTWEAVTLPGTPASYELHNVHCLNANYCWATGGLGTTEVVVLKWDGVSWTTWLVNTGAGQTGTQTTPVLNTYRVKAAWADTVTHGWGVTTSTNFIEFKSFYPTTATWTSPALDSGTVGTVWNNIAWDTTRPLTTDVTIATRTSADGVSWSAWSAEYTEPGGATITSPNARYLQYRATFTSGNQVDTATLEEVRIIRSALTPEPLYDLAGVAANDVWAVGDAGVIAHYNGTAWSLVTSPTSATLRGADAWSASLAFAVGSSGKIVKWNGSAWMLDTSPTSEDLYDVEFVSATEAWAVGTNGSIIKWNGTVWTVVASGTTAGLKGLSMVDSTNGFAVGAGGVIRRWNGTSWAASTSPTSQSLNAVNCFDMTRCAAVGDAGAIAMWNGTAWAIVTPSNGELTSRINGVRFQSLSDGWAVGDFGATVQWDGTSWTNVVSPTSRNLYSVSFPGGGLAWITGEIGSILSLSSSTGTNSVFLGAVFDTGSVSSTFLDAFFAYSSVAPSVITVAFRSGDTAAPDGTWTAWSNEQTLPSADTNADLSLNNATTGVALSPHQYIQFRLSLSTSNAAVIPYVDTYTLTYQ